MRRGARRGLTLLETLVAAAALASITTLCATLWAQVANQLPTYLDGDGLANYFPPRAEDGHRGSDRLTASMRCTGPL